MIDIRHFSIKTKISSLFALFGLISLLFFFLFFYKVVDRFVEEIKDREVVMVAHSLSPILRAAVELEMDGQINETLTYMKNSSENIVYAAVVTPQKVYEVGIIPEHCSKVQSFELIREKGEKIGVVKIGYTLNESHKLYKNYFLFALGYLCALVMAGGIVFVVVGKVLNPLQHYAQKLSSWKLGEVLEKELEHTSSELSVIDDALKETTHIIAQQYEKLLNYQSELEMAVKERTLELSMLNGELQKAVETEALLRRENEKFNDIMFDTTSLGLTLRDKNFAIIKSNKAYRDLFGEFETHLCSMTSTWQEVDEMIHENLKDPHSTQWAGEYSIANCQGDIIECFIVINKIEIYGAWHYIVAVSNITTVKQLEAQKLTSEKLLLQQSKLAAMGEMMGNIAHQWRQPLTQISSLMISLDMANEMGTLTDDVLHQKLSLGENLVKYMSQTIDDFRNFFLPNKTKVFFKPSCMINNVVSFMKLTFEASGIALQIVVECEKEIEGFDNEYGQVVMNILYNAKDNFLEKGIVHPKIVIRVMCVDEKVWVKISDNGGGIDPVIMDKIFEPYFTTKHKSSGTGLGLYMSKMIIEKNMGGVLDVVNTADGAEFNISV